MINKMSNEMSDEKQTGSKTRSPAELLLLVRPERDASDLESRLKSLEVARQRRARKHRRANTVGMASAAVAAAGLLAVVGVRQLNPNESPQTPHAARSSLPTQRVARNISAGFEVRELVANTRVWIDGPSGPATTNRPVVITSRRAKR